MVKCKITSKLIYILSVIDVSNIFLPHPNPSLVKGRGLDFPVSPLYQGGLRGVKNYNVLLFKHPLKQP